jgi:hypothetical protein
MTKKQTIWETGVFAGLATAGLLVGGLALGGACAETGTGDDAPSPDAGMPGTDAGTPGTDAGTPGTDAGTPGTDAGTPGTDAGTPGTDAGTPEGDGGAPGAPNVVINEIRAAGEDWIELYNAGTAPADLSGLRVCDRAADGTPKVEDAVAFPAGTTLAPGAFFVIVVDLSAPRAGLQTDCTLLGASGPLPCLEGGFGLSDSRGDAVYLLPADADTPLVSAEYPMNAVPSGQTYARLPDGTGAFAAGAPTPGAPNAAAP